MNSASRLVLLLGLLLSARAHAQTAEPAGSALPLPPPPPPPPAASAVAPAPVVAPEVPARPVPAAPLPSAAEAPPNEAARPPVVEMQPMSSVGQRLVFVRVRAGARRFSVVTSEHALPIADCDGECGFWAWPGRYNVRLRLDSAKKDSNVSLRIHGPGRYDFVPTEPAARTTGLVLGITGPLVMFVGALMTYVGFATVGCDDNSVSPCRNGPEPIGYYGLATLAAGAGMTTAGWIVFAHNRAHFELSRELGPLSPSARVSVVPLPHGGLGLGATVAF